jgi:hypothetical protein
MDFGALGRVPMMGLRRRAIGVRPCHVTEIADRAPLITPRALSLAYTNRKAPAPREVLTTQTADDAGPLDEDTSSTFGGSMRRWSRPLRGGYGEGKSGTRSLEAIRGYHQKCECRATWVPGVAALQRLEGETPSSLAHGYPKCARRKADKTNIFDIVIRKKASHTYEAVLFL